MTTLIAAIGACRRDLCILRCSMHSMECFPELRAWLFLRRRLVLLDLTSGGRQSFCHRDGTRCAVAGCQVAQAALLITTSPWTQMSGRLQCRSCRCVSNVVEAGNGCTQRRFATEPLTTVGLHRLPLLNFSRSLPCWSASSTSGKPICHQQDQVRP